MAMPGFPKLLVHRYLLNTVAGLHVPPKFCDVSLKKGFQLESATNFPQFMPKIKMISEKKKVFTLNQVQIFPIHAENQGDLYKKEKSSLYSSQKFSPFKPKITVICKKVFPLNCPI